MSSYLVSYGTEFDSSGEPGSTGPQALPASGIATLTVSDEAITTSSASSIDMSAAVDQIPVKGTQLTLSESALTLANRTSRSIAGTPVVWYSAATLPFGTSSWSTFGTSLLMSESTHDAALGVWKYIGPYGVRPGGLLTNERYPTAFGSYIVGTPSSRAAVAKIAGGSMSGFGFGLMEAVGTALDSYGQWTASASASVDAATKSVTINLTGIQTYLGFSLLGPVHGTAMLAQSLDIPDGPRFIEARTFSCTALPPTGNDPYTCQLSNDLGMPLGTLSGRFFGPKGKTFAGTFSLIGLFYGDNLDGMTGGVVLRAP